METPWPSEVHAIVHGPGTGSISRNETVAFALFKIPESLDNWETRVCPPLFA